MASLIENKEERHQPLASVFEYFSGADRNILKSILYEDRKEYLRIGKLNCFISIIFMAAVLLLAFVFPSNIVTLLPVFILVPVCIYGLLHSSRLMIRKVSYETRLLFIFMMIVISLATGFATFLLIAKFYFGLVNIQSGILIHQFYDFLLNANWAVYTPLLTVLMLMILLLSLVYTAIVRNQNDFYHQVIFERSKVDYDALQKQRERIVEEFRIKSELRNTKNTLTALTDVDESHRETISKYIGNLNEEKLTPESLYNAADFEFGRQSFSKAIEYIDKAIELDDEQMLRNPDYFQHPEFFELKSKILAASSGPEAAKRSLDRYVELNDEKRYRINLTKDILVDRLEVENLPFFGSFKWNLTPGINILLGKNGYGKSHLLRLLITMLYCDVPKIREWIPPNAHPNAKAKLYILSDHEINVNEINKIQAELKELFKKKKKLEEDIEISAQKISTVTSGEALPLPAIEIIQPAAPGKKEMVQLEKFDAQISECTERLDNEQRRILGNKDGIIGNIGRVPILAIPDSRFIDRSETSFGNSKSASEDLKKDGATEFLYLKSFANIINKGLYIIAQNNSKDFSKEPYSMIQRVISELGNSTANQMPENSATRSEKTFFKFIRVETVSTTGDYKFFVQSEENNDVVEMHNISQGTFSVLAICLMIYRFLVELKAESRDPLKEKAIVFIDEIDAHLHPSWEQKIIGILRREFPNVQFIITAHSPLIVKGCYEREVSVIRRVNNGFAIEQCQEDFIGYPTPELLTRVFEIEDKDDQFLIYSAMSGEKDNYDKRIAELESLKKKKMLPAGSEDELEDLYFKLNHINKVKEQTAHDSNISTLETENQMLKDQLNFLKEQISGNKEVKTT